VTGIKEAVSAGSARKALARVVLLARIEFHNSTDLSDSRLLGLCNAGVSGWAVGTLKLYVRYSRGADFSGTCMYASRRIYVNLGRHVTYPYRMQTLLARAKTVGRRWYKPSCTVILGDGYQVVLFVFMHELYHLLVKRAGRNIRQKESMCDRFAARFLADRFGAAVRGPGGRCVPRGEWDFQDLDGFVAAARDRRAAPRSARSRAAPPVPLHGRQLLLFPD